MIIESIVQAILHCSRCNARFRDDANDEWAGTYHWDSREAITRQFDNAFGEHGGWRRFGDRYVCGNCQISNGYGDDVNARETPEPLPAAEADKVARAHAQYFQAERHVIDLAADSWTIKHPLSCRPNLFDCPVNQAAERDLTEPPAEPGRHLCDVDGTGRLVIGNAVEVVAP